MILIISSVRYSACSFVSCSEKISAFNDLNEFKKSFLNTALKPLTFQEIIFIVFATLLPIKDFKINTAKTNYNEPVIKWKQKFFFIFCNTADGEVFKTLMLINPKLLVMIKSSHHRHWSSKTLRKDKISTGKITPMWQ